MDEEFHQAYTLSDLIDLSLKLPEVGAVNFNILHTVLRTIVRELKFGDIRPSFYIDDPLLENLNEIGEKLLPEAPKRFIPEESTAEGKVPEQVIKSASKKFTTKEESESDRKPITPEKSDERSPEYSKSDTAQTKEGELPPKEPAEKVDLQEKDIDQEILPPSLTPKGESKSLETVEAPTEKKIVSKPTKGFQRAGDAWKYRNLDERVRITEEGLLRVSTIVDMIAEKMQAAEKRKKEGGPQSEELEAIDDRIKDVEEALEEFAADHQILMSLQEKFNEMLAEFEKIKSLAALIEQMQKDILKKADQEETLAALALKGDLELVNTKVDQKEFETAIEELGEAIGLLGLKFRTKNDEWEERASEIWRGIDGKMSRDIFDAACAKIESRIIALMYGLRKLKEVVENLLYPEAAGVTRCLLCRRPACIFGLECLDGCASPKRQLSSRMSENSNTDNLSRMSDEALEKFDEPPHCAGGDTVITIPYSSTNNKSGKRDLKNSTLKLAPISSKKESVYKKTTASQVVKLPVVNQRSASKESVYKKPISSQVVELPAINQRQPAKRSTTPVIQLRIKPKPKADDLYFTRKKLAELERKEKEEEKKRADEREKEGDADIDISQSPASSEVTSSTESESSSASPKSNIDSSFLVSHLSPLVSNFPPVRFINDPKRRNSTMYPPPSNQKPNLTLSPSLYVSRILTTSTSATNKDKEKGKEQEKDKGKAQEKEEWKDKGKENEKEEDEESDNSQSAASLEVNSSTMPVNRPAFTKSTNSSSFLIKKPAGSNSSLRPVKELPKKDSK